MFIFVCFLGNLLVKKNKYYSSNVRVERVERIGPVGRIKLPGRFLLDAASPSTPSYTFFIHDHVDVDYFLELPNYFTKILEDDLKAVIKPQYVDQKDEVCKVLDLLKVGPGREGSFGRGAAEDRLRDGLHRRPRTYLCSTSPRPTLTMRSPSARSPAGPTSS